MNVVFSNKTLFVKTCPKIVVCWPLFYSMQIIPYISESIQFSLVTQLRTTLCDPIDCSSPGFLVTSSRSLLKLKSIELAMPSNHLILCRSILLPPLIFPSIRVFSKESVLCIRWPKYWSFNFSISPSNEYSGLSSFRMDWFDLLAVQETLKSLLQHPSQKHQFFGAQLSL